MSLNLFAIVVIGAVRRRYSDYMMTLFVVHVHVCMHVNVNYITRKHTYMLLAKLANLAKPEM